MNEERDRFNYQVHCFICTKCEAKDQNGNFVSGGALDLRKKLKDLCKDHFPKEDVRINASGCLSLCGEGISAVIYPENLWFSSLKVGDEEKFFSKIKRIIDNKKGGTKTSSSPLESSGRSLVSP